MTHQLNKSIAYLTNVYPAPSHSFIRREILALDELGWKVERISIRRTTDTLADPTDQREALRTRVLLDAGALRLAAALFASMLLHPWRFFQAVNCAWAIGRRSDRGLLLHIAYLAEACLLLRWLRELRIEHLHAHFGTNSTTVALLCRILGGPTYSFTVHGPEEFDKATVLGLKTKIAHARFVVAISQYGRSQLLRWCLPEMWDRIHVVHCGLDRAYLDAQITRPADNQRLVSVGRLCEQKGQLLLVEALARVARTGTAVELVLVGDGPMRSLIENRVEALGLKDSVRITGWASGDTVQKEIKASTVLSLPSFAEGLPVVIMEALAMGRPVISTYVAGIPELVQPGENGWLVPAGDVDALAAAIEDALQVSIQRLAEMGQAGRRAVLERHDVRKEAAKLASLFCS